VLARQRSHGPNRLLALPPTTFNLSLFRTVRVVRPFYEPDLPSTVRVLAFFSHAGSCNYDLRDLRWIEGSRQRL